MSEYSRIDPGLSPLFRYLSELTVLEGVVGEDEALRLLVESLRLSLPMDLDISVGPNGQVVLGASPPMMYAPIGLMPVFHQVRMTIVPTENLLQDF